MLVVELLFDDNWRLNFTIATVIIPTLHWYLRPYAPAGAKKECEGRCTDTSTSACA